MKKISILLVVICFLILGLAGCGGTGTAKSEKASFHASNPYEGDLSGVTLDIGAAGIQNAQGVLQAAGLDDTPYTVHSTISAVEIWYWKPWLQASWMQAVAVRYHLSLLH